MNFDVNRLAKLAGLGSTSSDQMLNESHEYTDETTLTELGNQRKRDEQGEEDEHGHQLAEGDDDVLEIDEDVLREEIRKLKQERLAESKLRSAIRSELSDILSEVGYNQDGSWVYGNNKPTKSKLGQIVMGTVGIGFE